MRKLSKYINYLLFFYSFWVIFIIVKLLTYFFYITGFKYWRFFIKNKSVLYFENFPIENAGYQYRAKKWSDILNENGFKSRVITTVKGRFKFEKLVQNRFKWFLIKSMVIRFLQILYSIMFQKIIVRRELLQYNDYGNLFMEKFLFSIHRKDNVILDFDDDLAAAKKQPKSKLTLFGKLLFENGNKFNESLRLYNRFIVGSDYLRKRVLCENTELAKENVLILPTCVDYDVYPPKKYPDNLENIYFGWIGGNHNYHLLDRLIPLLDELSHHYNFNLIVIGGEIYKRDVNFNIEFIPWSLKTEVQNIYKIDIGLMPLTDNAENRGKSGFKLIQYMGLGIVSVATNITINGEIVEHKKNSFLANNDKQWKEILTGILENKFDLRTIGLNARKTIKDNYTFNSKIITYRNFI
ncbi:MAG: hypothetical protein Kow0068_05340 [Marinilabiliales bacterium]